MLLTVVIDIDPPFVGSARLPRFIVSGVVAHPGVEPGIPGI
jgi:hypothetical protein